MYTYRTCIHFFIKKNRKKALNNKSGTAKETVRKLKPANSARPGSYAQLKKHMKNNPLRPTNNLKEHLTGLLGALVGLPEHQIMRPLSFIQNLHIMHIHNKREISLVQCCLLLTRVLLKHNWGYSSNNGIPNWQIHFGRVLCPTHTHMLSSTGSRQINIMAMGSPLIE